MSNNEIQLIVPLSALPAETELTAAGILKTIGAAETQRAAAEHWKRRYNEVAGDLRSAGKELEAIMFERAYTSDFNRVRAIREFVEALKVMGTQNMEAPQ